MGCLHNGWKRVSCGWSALRYSTLSCLLGTISAGVIVWILTLTGYVSVPSMETITIVSPHLLFMIIFPGLIALIGWNFGVSILTPLNGLLFINFVPVTTLVISLVQGNEVNYVELIGITFIMFSLIANNMFLRKQQKNIPLQQIKQSVYFYERNFIEARRFSANRYAILGIVKKGWWLCAKIYW